MIRASFRDLDFRDPHIVLGLEIPKPQGISSLRKGLVQV